MGAIDETLTLRPLSTGEVFDRAVTLFARYPALFALIALAVAVPASVMGYFASDSKSFAVMMIALEYGHQASVPGAAPPWVTLACWCVPWVLSPFANVAVEHTPLTDALSESFARVFDANEIRRALVFGLSLVAVVLGASFVNFAVAALLAAALHVPANALVAPVQSATSIVSFSIVSLVLAVYYYDVRIRREGYDIELSLRSLEAAT